MDWMAFEPARLVPLHVIGNVAGAGEADSYLSKTVEHSTSLSYICANFLK